MKDEVWMCFNGELLLVVRRGDLIDVYTNIYLMDLVEAFGVDLDDILFVSEYLGEL